MFCEADFCRKAKQKHFLWISQWLCVYLCTGLGTLCFGELILRKVFGCSGPLMLGNLYTFVMTMKQIMVVL